MKKEKKEGDLGKQRDRECEVHIIPSLVRSSRKAVGMKRGFSSIEISDDEWSNHDFDSSRILNTNSKPPAPPAIESFAFTPASASASVKPSSSFGYSSDSSSDCVEIINKEKEVENLEDDDFGDAPISRGRRFVIEDDDDDDDNNAIDLDDGDSDDDDELGFSEEDENVDDVVGKALHKCAKISAELRKHLYGSSSSDASHRYSQVDDVSSSVKIVTHVSISLFISIF